MAGLYGSIGPSTTQQNSMSSMCRGIYSSLVVLLPDVCSRRSTKGPNSSLDGGAVSAPGAYTVGDRNHSYNEVVGCIGFIHLASVGVDVPPD